jgi:hypothetical protein
MSKLIADILAAHRRLSPEMAGWLDVTLVLASAAIVLLVISL